MKRIALLLFVIAFFTSCKSHKIVTQQKDLNYNIQQLLTQLDSLGLDTSNYTLLFKEGYQGIFYGQNDYGNALINYSFSKNENISAENYRHSSVQNTKNGNYSIAIDKLEKAFQINPQETAGYYAWVLLYYYRDYEKSLKILEQLDAYTPNFADAPLGEDIHYLKGLCHLQMQHHEKAIEEFNTYINNLANSHGEDFVDVYTFVQKGRCLSELGKFEDAIKSFEKAISYYKDCTEAYYFMGLTQVKMKHNTKACHNFNVALEMINKGEKSIDVYVELFHEVYPQQIEQSINDYCK